MKRRGFTLIELLVVIAIIAILAAILFPVFMSAKERARQAMCCGNLKQLTQAFFSYADDNGGYLPVGSSRIFHWGNQKVGGIYMAPPYEPPLEWTGTTWLNDEPPPAIDVSKGSLWRYVRARGVYECPSDKNMPMWYDSNPAHKVPNFGLSYSLNWTMGVMDPAGSPCKTVCLAAAVGGRSAKVLMLIHEYRGDRTHFGVNDGYYSWDPTNATADIFAKIHWDGTTCSYADGHVRRISNKRIKVDMNPPDQKSDWYRNDQRL